MSDPLARYLSGAAESLQRAALELLRRAEAGAMPMGEAAAKAHECLGQSVAFYRQAAQAERPLCR